MAYEDYIHLKILTLDDHFHTREDWQEERNWCAEHFGPSSRKVYEHLWEWNDKTWACFYGGYFSFAYEEDAMAFKLRWL